MLWTALMLAGLAAIAPTQTNDAAPINKHNFKIPIVIAPERRAQIKELLLFVSDNEGQTWNQAAKNGPKDEEFKFFASKDGIYWFVVAVVDLQDHQDPPDPNKVEPHKILVDTVSPIVQLQSVEWIGDEVVVRWAIQEDHPDANSIRLDYSSTAAGPAAQWTQVQVLPGLTGQARFRPNVAGPLAVRLEMRDIAKNVGSAVRDLPAAPPPAATAAVGPGAPVAFAPGGAPPVVSPTPQPAPPLAASAGLSPLAQGNPIDAPGRADGWPSDPSRGGVVNQAVYPPADPDGRRLLGSNAPHTQTIQPASLSTPAPGLRPMLPPVQVVNARQIGLQYEVTESGASGVGRIEVFITSDDGLTWVKAAESAEPRPPIQVTLPQDGVVYGLRLVLTSGAGVSRGAPLRGETPEMRVELDTQLPVVNIYEPHADPTLRDRLVILWSASDRNLTATPITLEWSAESSKGWEQIATQLPNTGTYTWQMPPNLPPRVYLRVTAVDTAGNRGVVATSEPTLIDQVKPAGRLVGIAAVVHPQVQPSPPAPPQPSPQQQPLPDSYPPTHAQAPASRTRPAPTESAIDGDPAACAAPQFIVQPPTQTISAPQAEPALPATSSHGFPPPG